MPKTITTSALIIKIEDGDPPALHIANVGEHESDPPEQIIIFSDEIRETINALAEAAGIVAEMVTSEE